MLAAAALAAVALATTDPTARGYDPLAAPTSAAAVAYCMRGEPAPAVYRACFRAEKRDVRARRALGPAYVWARPILDAEGWSVRGVDADRVTLSKDGEGTLAKPRAWLRAERRVVGETAPYLSAVWLYEFDCAQQAMQVLQTTLYAGNNQQGAAMILPADKPKPEYANPGTVADAMMRDICGPAQTVSR